MLCFTLILRLTGISCLPFLSSAVNDCKLRFQLMSDTTKAYIRSLFFLQQSKATIVITVTITITYCWEAGIFATVADELVRCMSAALGTKELERGYEGRAQLERERSRGRIRTFSPTTLFPRAGRVPYEAATTTTLS